MSQIDNQSGISLSSYSKAEWEILLKETAYRGLKIHKLAKQSKKAQGCRFEDEHLINLITSKGKTIIIDMHKVLKKRDRWALSRLVHNIRMLFSNSKYATKFNNRIAKLAETLTLDSRPKHFHNRCQENLGNFAMVPTDIHDQIIYAMPIGMHEKTVDLMKMFWKAPLGQETIFGTIDVQKFANWVVKAPLSLFTLNLSDADFKTLLPYIERLWLDPKEFNFAFFDLITTCKNLKSLSIVNSTDFTDDHCQHIAKLSNLRSLYISDCKNLSNKGLEQLSGLSKLENLNLENCKVTGEGLRSVQKLSNLKYLSLSECILTEDETLSHLTDLTKLSYLSLRDANLSREGYKQLENLRFLKTICITYGNFREEDLESVGKIASLNKVEIHNTHMTGAGLKYLTNLNDLQHLNLEHCENITENNLPYIAEMKKLTFLDVNHCRKLSIESLQQFRKSMAIRYPDQTQSCPRGLNFRSLWDKEFT